MLLNPRLEEPAVETLHGVSVCDPYRWLEDRSCPETEGWINKQQQLWDEYSVGCRRLDILRDRVRKYLARDMIDQPLRVADLYFYRRRKNEDEQGCLCFKPLGGDEHILVDPRSEGPFVSLGIYRIASDGSLLAYDARKGGADTVEIRFVHVSTGRIHPDTVEPGYARGLSFTLDNSGVYFCQERTDSCGDHTIRFHRFGVTDEDRIILRRKRSLGSRLLLVSDDKRLGAVWVHGQDGHSEADLLVASRFDDRSWIPVITDHEYPFVPSLIDGRLFVLFYGDAPNGRLVELAEDGSEVALIIPEQRSLIYSPVFTRTTVHINTYNEGRYVVQGWTLSGKDLGRIDIPRDGTVELLRNQVPGEDGFFYTYESFTQPLMTYEYSVSSRKAERWNESSLGLDLPTCRAISKHFQSKDGTTIPMTLVSRDGPGDPRVRPCFLTGYGGFGVPTAPQFSVLVAILLELGAVVALPNIRGGSEFGRSWHEAARGRNRQVAFDDFLAAAEWLHEQKITCSGQLAIFGASNSGLLVGAAMTQRPDLFGAVLCIAPLLDMVRYERFDKAKKWWGEYGTVEDARDFRSLYSYSPYHRVEENVNYPAILFVSGDKDERCNPAHVRKMAARLQNRSAQAHPVLLDYAPNRGHAPTVPFSLRIEALARRLAFLCRELNIHIPGDDADEAPCS